MLHAKLIVIDDVVYVGSANLDPRSLRINFEIMLRIGNAGLAATARRQFEEELAHHSLRITREQLRQRRPWWLRVAQRLAYYLFVRLDPELAALRLQAWRPRRNRLLARRNPESNGGRKP